MQYIHPSDAVKLGQAELVVVDEAAAIPLPLVKELISGIQYYNMKSNELLFVVGPYLVFLASTINGYEGTGRSLSLKLLDSLRKQSSGYNKGEKAMLTKGILYSISRSLLYIIGRALHEMTLEESIRYKSGDPVIISFTYFIFSLFPF